MPERRRGRPTHPDVLTPAERRVIEELRKGGTNAEIAVRIGIGPESVKTHVSNMLAKLNLEDRRQLAAWREETAPRRGWLWLLVPVPGKPLAAFGVVAGVAMVIAVMLLLALLGATSGDGAGEIVGATETTTAAPTEEPQGSEGGEMECATETTATAPTAESLYIEGVGEVEGPVAVYRKFEQPQERGGPREGRVFAIDLATGRSWDIYAYTVVEPILALPTGNHLVVWSPESLSIYMVSLDGESEVLLHSGGAYGPSVSFDGSKIAFAVDGSPSGEPDSIIVLDVQSGDEILRIEADDPRLDAVDSEKWSLDVLRWSVDGAALLSMASFGRGSGAGDFVLTLDGEVRDTPSGLLSLDLRYGAIAPGLSAGARSLTVVEVATGRVLFTLTPERGNRIIEWYWGTPASCRAIYATSPAGAANERPVRSTVWRIVDLDTGGTTIVSPEEILRDEWLWLQWLQGPGVSFPMAQCFHRHQALDLCSDLNVASQEALQFIYRDQERRERNTSIRTTQLLGFVWLD